MQQASRQSADTREKLILAGISVLQEQGVSGFSIRQTTARCGLSAAALYKHFSGKEELLSGIITYIHDRWSACQAAVLEECRDKSVREKLIAVSMSYIRFLMENPHFRSVIMIRDDNMSPEHVRLKSQVSLRTRELIGQYCAEIGMSAERQRVKTFIVRSLIYGAALMFDNGEMEYTDENFRFVSETISREFDLQ